MNTKDITQLTAYLLTQYYKNDTKPFLDNCHEDVLWLGPAKNQIIRGKENLIKAYENENNSLKFDIDNLTATPIHITNNSLEVLLTFMVDTFWPNGDTNRVYQRISFAWEINKDTPLIHFIHISNAIDYDARDNIYPIHYLENHKTMTLYTDSKEKLLFKGINSAILYTRPEQIIYMESKGTHTLIHLESQTFECINRLSTIKTNEKLIKVHASYIVNPRHVRTIQRFYLTLNDGTKIPVPEKKYTAVKALLYK